MSGFGMWDGIYYKSDSVVGHRLYPSEKILKRDFDKELKSIDYQDEPEITILTMFCGRFHCLAPYMWSLGNMDYPKEKINLIFYCTTPLPVFHKLLESAIKKVGKYYKSAQLVWDTAYPPSELAHSEKNNDVNLHLDNIPKLYARALKYIKTRYLFLFEDDQVNPSHIIRRHLKVVQLKDVVSSCGVAFDRHHDKKPVAFDFILTSSGDVKGVQNEARFSLTPVGSGGLGSTVMDMDICKDYDFVQQLSGKPHIMGSDVCLGYQINESNKVILYDWDVHSYHIDSQDNIV